MANFLAELKRRNIYRVGATYVIAAWAVAQVIDLLSQVFSLPSWIAQPTIIVLAVGFPIALLVAWVAESKPQRVIASAVRSKPTTVDWMLFAAVVVLIALSGYRLIAPSSDTATRQAGVDAARSAASSPSAISIAVLPFANLSSDSEQEFFSDGMTEEITSALAKVSGLMVIGRTSAFEFKGQNRDLRMIGQALGTTHLIEGSVRKAGDRVRITAQLIRTDSGAHLWTESYDRQLTDVFAIQEEIAQAIAGALRVPLGLGRGETLVSNRTNDLESHDQYLRARALIRARAPVDAIKLLEPGVVRDPGFAPTWALLAQAYILLAAYNPGMRLDPIADARRDLQSSQDKAETAAREAVRLDARSADGYTAQALVQAVRGKWAAAENLYLQALALDPNDPDALHHYSNMLDDTGRLQDALILRQKLRTLEPFVPIFNIVTAAIMRDNGQQQSAIQILEAIPTDSAAGYYRNLILAQAYAAEGRYAEAADTLVAIRTNLVSRRSVEDAARLLSFAPTQGAAPQALPHLDGELSFVYAHVGALDRVLEFPERSVQLNNVSVNGIRFLWLPEVAPARKTERFKALMRNAGLVDYWRTNGWPDLCRAVGTDDFVCD